MDNEEAADMLLQYATAALCEENVKFLILARKWRKDCMSLLAASGSAEEGQVGESASPTANAIDDSDACERARAIREEFLKPGAELPVNLPGRILKPFADELSTFTVNMFDAAIDEATLLVRNDTFDMFCRDAKGYAFAKEHPELTKG